MDGKRVVGGEAWTGTSGRGVKCGRGRRGPGVEYGWPAVKIECFY